MIDQSFEATEFTPENFERLFVTSAEYISCTFKKIDLNGLDLSNTRFIECVFMSSNLSNARLKNVTMRNCEFMDCKLMGIDWSVTQALIYPKYENCSLDFCIFNSMQMKKSVFKECSLKDADFYSSQLSGSDFSGSLLSGSNFSRADLSHCDFRGAKDYSIEPTYTNISKAKFSLPEAMALLKSFDVVIE